MCWLTPLTPALGRQMQEDLYEFEACLVYTASASETLSLGKRLGRGRKRRNTKLNRSKEKRGVKTNDIESKRWRREWVPKVHVKHLLLRPADCVVGIMHHEAVLYASVLC